MARRFAPAGTPVTIVTKLRGAVNDALALPETQQSFEAKGLTATPATGEGFADLVEKETRTWVDIVKKSGATVDRLRITKLEGSPHWTSQGVPQRRPRIGGLPHVTEAVVQIFVLDDRFWPRAPAHRDA